MAVSRCKCKFGWASYCFSRLPCEIAVYRGMIRATFVTSGTWKQQRSSPRKAYAKRWPLKEPVTSLQGWWGLSDMDTLQELKEQNGNGQSRLGSCKIFVMIVHCFHWFLIRTCVPFLGFQVRSCGRAILSESTWIKARRPCWSLLILTHALSKINIWTLDHKVLNDFQVFFAENADIVGWLQWISVTPRWS